MDLFGSIGLLLLLSAFTINQCKKIPRRTFIYNGLNFVGAGILAIYSYHIDSIVFLVLNIIWVIVSGFFLADIFHKTQILKIEKLRKKKNCV